MADQCAAVHPDYDGSHHYEGTCNLPVGHPPFVDDEGGKWDHVHFYDGEPSMLWNVVPVGIKDRLHLVLEVTDDEHTEGVLAMLDAIREQGRTIELSSWNAPAGAYSLKVVQVGVEKGI